MTAVVEARGISVAFGGVRAVQAVDLAVPAGERRVIIGPNGAGKTTLFNLIGGQIRPTAGRVLLDGTDITAQPAWKRARLGLARTFQISRVFLSLTVWDNLMLASAGVSGLTARSLAPPQSDRASAARVDALLDLWGLAAFRTAPVDSLSYGTQRLLEIAIAFAPRPKVVLLDEPTAGLSGGEREMVTGRLQSLSRDVTLLLTDHDMDVVFRVADAITVLDRGQAVAQGEPARIRGDAAVRDIYLGRI